MHPNFELKCPVEEKFSCIICANFLELVAAKFNLNLVFVPLFISSY